MALVPARFGYCYGCAALLSRRVIQDLAICDVKHRRKVSTATGAKRKALSRMKAWQIHRYGGNEELSLATSARVPRIDIPKDILIEVHAASVNPIDTEMRGGYGRTLINQMRTRLGTSPSDTEFPLTLGRDFSGVVVQTGYGVTRFKPGDQVWGSLAAHRQGTHAQYTVAGEREISLKPVCLSHVEAACLPYVVNTVWSALCLTGEMSPRNTPGKRVLIHGGAGGIGTFAIQLMKAWGAHVVTTCSTDAIPLVESLGADEVIDYRKQDVNKELRRIEKVDIVLDPVGGEATASSEEVLKTWQNAKYVTLVMPLLPSTDKFGLPGGLIQSASSLGYNALKGFSKGRSYRWAFFIPDGNALKKVADMVQQGKIRPILDKEFSFEALPEAYEKVSQRHGRGKSVINMMV